MPPVDKPNYTQIPNAILDNMASMTMPEVCVVMAICRQTFGWHKKSEKLSVAQLRQMTGLSKDAVMRALDAALEHGWITRKPAGQTYRYTVHVQEVEVRQTYHLHEVDVREKDRYVKQTGTGNVPVNGATGTANVPVPVRQTYQQNAKTLEVAATPKERKETNFKESNTRVEKSARVVQPKTPPAPAVTIWHELTGLQPNQSQTNLIAQTVTDCDLWRIRLTEWLANGYKPASVSSQLDVYANGWQRKPHTNGHTPSPEPKSTRRLAQPIFAEE